MRLCRSALAVAMLWSGTVVAQQDPEMAGPAGGGSIATHEGDVSGEIERLHPGLVAKAREMNLPEAFAARDGVRQPNLQFPMRARPNSRNVTPFSMTNFVDRDPSSGVLDFACGRRTYDTHNGIDMVIAPFWWTQMDREEVEVVAAAPGTIVEKYSGTYTGCRTGLNMVVVLQADGLYAYYAHMKQGLNTTKPVGARVEAGEYLGRVGNTGNSAWPHLHFHLLEANGTVVDPFAGACNPGASTLWKHQWPTPNDTRTLSLTTASAAPVRTFSCETGQTDDPKFADRFTAGAQVFAIAGIRDQNPGDGGTLQISRPDGTVAYSSAFGTVTESISDGYWYWRYDLPAAAPAGVWKTRAAFKGQVTEGAFFVGIDPAPANLFAAVLPGGRSVQNASPATLFATILNASANPAYGCWIATETPIDADFSYQPTDSATNLPTGTPNASVTIAPNTSQSFVISLQPRAAALANAWTTRLRFKCQNADAAPVFDGVNTALISMSPSPVPDVIPVGVTPSQDGVVRLPSTSGSQVFAAAAVNIGAAATLTVTPSIGGGASASALVCRTDAQGQCAAPPSPSVSHVFAPSAPATFTVFVTASGAIAFDPSAKRVRLEFLDAGLVSRGQTSAALTTP